MSDAKAMTGGSHPDPTVRDRVLIAFVDLVTERGLSHTSVDDIADRAKISKTTLYTRWPDRRALVLDGFRYIAQGLPESDHELSFAEMFDVLIGRTTTGSTDQQFFRVFAEAIAAGQVDTDIGDVVKENHQAWTNVVRDLIDLGKRSGDIPADRDVDVATEVLLGVVSMRHLIGLLPIDASLRDLVWRLLTSPTPY